MSEKCGHPAYETYIIRGALLCGACGSTIAGPPAAALDGAGVETVEEKS